MATEIERKFLVKRFDGIVDQGSHLKQGYLSTDPERTVRVRLVDETGYITIKGLTVSCSRPEFEYTIPADEANEMLDRLCQKPLIEKMRYKVSVEDVVFEIDRFLGENEGLIIAEVELSDENQRVPRPDWLGEEVTDDPRYFNANLVKHPYARW